MSSKSILLCLLFLLAGSGLRAQMTWDDFEGISEKAKALDTGQYFARTPLFDGFELPSHVRSNPRGYSPLCRLELKIEDQLPVGMWVKLGEKPLTTSYFRTNAEVRFKLLKF